MVSYSVLCVRRDMTLLWYRIINILLHLLACTSRLLHSWAAFPLVSSACENTSPTCAITCNSAQHTNLCNKTYLYTTFHMHSMHSMIKISWSEYVQNILSENNPSGITCMVIISYHSAADDLLTKELEKLVLGISCGFVCAKMNECGKLYIVYACL